jgi:hypothetical protein
MAPGASFLPRFGLLKLAFASGEWLTPTLYLLILVLILDSLARLALSGWEEGELGLDPEDDRRERITPSLPALVLVAPMLLLGAGLPDFLAAALNQATLYICPLFSGIPGIRF